MAVLASSSRIPDNPGNILWRILGISVVSHRSVERGPGTQTCLVSQGEHPCPACGVRPGSRSATFSHVPRAVPPAEPAALTRERRAPPDSFLI